MIPLIMCYVPPSVEHLILTTPYFKLDWRLWAYKALNEANNLLFFIRLNWSL